IINGVSSAYAAAFTISDGAASQTVSGTVSDNAGNPATPYNWSGKVDGTLPSISTTLNPALPNGNNGWYTSSPTVTASCADSFSGVSTLTYKINSGSTVTYSSGFQVPDGPNTVTFTCTSVSGMVATTNFTVDVDTGASFTGPLLTTPANATTFSYPAGQTISLTWNAAADPFSGISGYHITISSHSDLSSPTVNSDLGVVLLYGPWTPPSDGTWYWDVSATDGAGTLKWSTNGHFSFTRIYNIYNPPQPNNLVATMQAYAPYPSIGPQTVNSTMAWLRGRPLDAILTVTFTGSNQYGSWTNRSGLGGGSATAAVVTGFHYYPPSGGSVAYPITSPVLRLDKSQNWGVPGKVPASCAVGNNYCVAWTVDLSVTYDDGIVIQWNDLPRSSFPGQYLIIPAGVQKVQIAT
ncbi:MAG: hypothetical protein KGJ86_05765, partial [Chloroflexota bacterium]|nr:hypothetical protein [Chloroflexota bacterium]